MKINIDSYLNSVEQACPKYNRNSLQSNKEMVARLAQYIFVGCQDNAGQTQCESCGTYRISVRDEPYYKFCPRCGKRLIKKEG